MENDQGPGPRTETVEVYSYQLSRFERMSKSSEFVLKHDCHFLGLGSFMYAFVLLTKKNESLSVTILQ